LVIHYGKIIGNDITTVSNSYISTYYGNSVLLLTDASATNDTMLIIGNKITANAATGTQLGIQAATTSQFVSICNNYVTTTTAGSQLAPIYLGTVKNSVLGRNSVINNTINALTQTLSYFGGIYIGASPANGYIDVVNNLILSQGGVGVYAPPSSGPIAVSYNLMNNPLTLTNITNDGTNNLSSNTTLNTSGKPNAGSDAINGGSSDEAYYDINLTRNDAGAYGGSFTLDNFFPVTGSARVYFISAPRKVLSGGTLNVQGGSFDR